MHECEVEIISFVITFEGIVTKYHDTDVKKIIVDDKTKTYIQSIVLKKTLEAMLFDYQRYNMHKRVGREAAITDAFE